MLVTGIFSFSQNVFRSPSPLGSFEVRIVWYWLVRLGIRTTPPPPPTSTAPQRQFPSDNCPHRTIFSSPPPPPPPQDSRTPVNSLIGPLPSCQSWLVRVGVVIWDCKSRDLSGREGEGVLLGQMSGRGIILELCVLVNTTKYTMQPGLCCPTHT